MWSSGRGRWSRRTHTTCEPSKTFCCKTRELLLSERESALSALSDRGMLAESGSVATLSARPLGQLHVSSGLLVPKGADGVRCVSNVSRGRARLYPAAVKTIMGGGDD